jgi:hypothetical protein
MTDQVVEFLLYIAERRAMVRKWQGDEPVSSRPTTNPAEKYAVL